MTGRTSSTPTAEAAAPNERARKRRNILLAIALPIVLAVAYLAGMSTADARSNAVPALILNEDEMVEQQADDGSTSQVVAGRLLVSHLMAPENGYGFDWELADAETAADQLATGDAHVVVTIPSNFSASVVSLGTGAPEQAGLTITTDQAHDYLSAQTADVLADAVVAQFGSDVTEMVAIGLVQGFDATGEGMQEAADGAGQLASGATELEDGFTTYTEGQDEITSGLNETATGTQELESGATTYVSGVDTFASGASQFASGANDFASGVTEYTSGVQTFTGGVTSYTAGVDELSAGLAELDASAAPVAGAAGQLSQASEQISGAVSGLEDAQKTYASEIEPSLAAVPDNIAVLEGICAEIEDPARQSECFTATGSVSGAAGGGAQFIDGVMAQTGSVAEVGGSVEELAGLAGGLTQLTGGISSAASGAAELSSSSPTLNDGATQLSTSSDEVAAGAETISSTSGQIVDGATQLQTAGTSLTNGTSELSNGVGQLAEGQTELTSANPDMQEGIAGLSSGATELETGLQEGANEANGALGDAESYAGVLAHPVVANVESQHDPRFGGILAALAVPIAAWVAAFITMLARRLITPEALASTATTTRLLGQSFLRIGVPVLAATMGVALIAHIVGAPWVGIFGTMTLGVLLVAAVTALHVLFVALWGRRGGAIASLVGLVLQLATLRGLLPTELRSGWAEVLATFAPLSHASAGLQLIYAGGGTGAIVTAYIALLLITAIATGAAWLVIERARRSSLDHIINLRAIGRSLRPADATTPQ